MTFNSKMPARLGRLAFVLIGGGACISSAQAQELAHSNAVVIGDDEPAPVQVSGIAVADAKALQQAELEYKSGSYDAALERFGVIAAMSGHPLAWLRVGNVWHRRGNVGMALDAYQRARDAASTAAQHSRLRYRAVMNMALLGLEQASQALQEVGPLDTARISPVWLREVKLRLVELQADLPAGLSIPTTSPPAVPPVGASEAAPAKSSRLPFAATEPGVFALANPPTSREKYSSAAKSPMATVARARLARPQYDVGTQATLPATRNSSAYAERVVVHVDVPATPLAKASVKPPSTRFAKEPPKRATTVPENRALAVAPIKLTSIAAE